MNVASLKQSCRGGGFLFFLTQSCSESHFVSRVLCKCFVFLGQTSAQFEVCVAYSCIVMSEAAASGKK